MWYTWTGTRSARTKTATIERGSPGCEDSEESRTRQAPGFAVRNCVVSRLRPWSWQSPRRDLEGVRKVKTRDEPAVVGGRNPALKVARIGQELMGSVRRPGEKRNPTAERAGARPQMRPRASVPSIVITGTATRTFKRPKKISPPLSTAKPNEWATRLKRNTPLNCSDP